MTTVFVYGTLKKGFELAYLLENETFIGLARSAPRYGLVSLEGGDYPGLYERPDHGRSITGELWSVSPTCLASLDRVEGVAEGLYERAPIELLAPHVAAEAEAYFYLGKMAGLPDAGTDWK